VLYPICLILVWVPSVVLGVLGNIDFPPPIEGPILVHLILRNSGGLLAGLLAAGVFAVIMGSLDNQAFAAGTLFTQDIVRHYGFHDGLSERGQVLTGRLFVAAFLAVAFFVSLATSRTIFDLGVWSLSGFAALFPVVVASLYWRRSTGAGVVASIATVALLWIGFFLDSLGSRGEYTVGETGLLPVAFLFAGAVVSLVAVSLVTSPPPDRVLDRFFPAR
jgi:SSS family solute:Na+ symporter